MKEGWEIKTIGDVCSVAAGQGAPQGDANYCVKGTPFIKAGNLEDLVNGLSEHDVQNVSDEVAKQHRLKLYKQGSVVFAKSGMSCMKGYVYSLKTDCYVVSHLAILTPFGISTSFLRYLLELHRPNSLVKDAAYPSISLEDIKSFRIPVPPISEQERIVAELDCLSDIIEKQKQQLKELDNLAQSIFYTTFGDPTSNKFGWKNRRLGDIVNSNMIGLTRSGSEQDASYEYLYFKMNNIGNEGGVDWSKTTRVNACAQEVEKYTLKEGDFLFNTRNSFELVGKTCIYPHIDGEVCLFNNNIMRIDFKKEINVTYMAYLFQDKYIKNQLDRIKKGTTSVWAIYYKDLEKIDILVPDIALQEEFASKIAAIEKQKDMIKQSIAETETLFNSRMDYYFN